MPVDARITNLPSVEQHFLGARRLAPVRTRGLQHNFPKPSKVLQASAKFGLMAHVNAGKSVPKVSAPRVNILA